MMNRREFMQVLAAAAGAGLPLLSGCSRSGGDRPEAAAKALYDLPRFGNVHLLHTTDTHAQLTPVYFREPSVNIGVASALNRPPHLVGEHFLKHYGIPPGSAAAHAFTCLDFTEAARQYGKVGGFAHLATLVKQLKASRPGALLCDGGDTWQGSATALWTDAQDMVDATLQLGVDVMTGHWEFTYGEDRMLEILDKDLSGKIDFVAQNVLTRDFEDPVFKPYVIREMNGVAVAIVGQAFPYTPIANPSHLIPEWSFGIREGRLQEVVDEARDDGAQVVVVLSHNGADVDIKLASRIRGVDAILGGHTHDGMPEPVLVDNPGGKTLVTNAGSNGKFVGVLDFDFRDNRVQAWQYKLLPVFSDMLPADPDMQALIDRVRAPYNDRLNEVLATTDDTLYRRGNFNGSFDQLIVDSLMEAKGAQIAFSPGFRWGTSLLPGDAITMERLMDQTAITYPATTLNNMSGEMIKTILEDVADNLFNPDPYYQQGGDMVRVGGLEYAIAPNAEAGNRIRDMRLGGKAIEAGKTYKVAGWASVQPNVEGEPIWDVVGNWLRDRKSVSIDKLNQPRIIGIDNNQGLRTG